MSFLIRPATHDDLSSLAAIHLASKRKGESGIIDSAYLAAMSAQEYQEKWHGFVADPDSQQDILFINKDTPAGLISYGALRTAPAGMSKIRPLYSSEIYAIYVHPDYFKQGLGTALLKQAVIHLKEQKHQSLCLWALKKNKRACAFYEAFGGQRVGKKKTEFGPTTAEESCFAWRDINVILSKP